MAGSQGEEREISLRIQGMSCVTCSKAVEGALKCVPGVVDASVNFTGATARVACHHDVQASALLKAVEKAGYHAQVHLAGSHDHHQMENTQRDGWLLALCIAMTLPFLIQMVSMATPYPFALSPAVQLGLATVVQILGGWAFYRSTYYALRSGIAGMDTLIAIGTTAAYAASIYAMFRQGALHLYFETSAVIITLVLFGRWLEARSKGKASQAIGKLAAIQPPNAAVERSGKIVIVPVADVVKGDILVIKAGERVPVDGIVLSGSSQVDQSVVTGESIPKMLLEGSHVLAGTLNIDGALRVRAEGVGADTLLAGMVRMVERAQQSESPIQRLADQVSSIFIPIVLLIALAAFAGWLLVGSTVETAMVNAIAVLVIACPCALGLATPIVITVAGGRGATSGILFKEASSIERAHRLDVMFFDKTGTLTQGRPSVADIVPVGDIAPDTILSKAASLEKHVDHPIAHAIVEESSERRLESNAVSEFRAIAGKGAFGKEGKALIGVGSIAFAKESGIAIDEQTVFALQKQGKSVIVVWQNSVPLGYIAVSDRVRDNAYEAIQKLKANGIESIMLTGDNPLTAESIAKDAGINRFYAGLLPQDKLDAIHQAKEKGKVVGMIGDGINDAPALAAADVGFALGASTDVAMEAASIALMRNDLLSVPAAISLANAAFSKIRQNLFFAFAYNIIGIPLAAFGWLNPVIAASAMVMSSLSVVLNALLLTRWKE